MKKLLDRIEHFLITQTVWMFMSVIMLVSILLIVESDDQSWGIYLSFLGLLTLSYSPTLLFSLYRESLIKKLNLRFFLFIWIAIFILYPILLSALGSQGFMIRFFQVFHSHVDIRDTQDGTLAILASVGFSLFCAEVAYQFNDYLRKKSRSISWLKKMGLEKTILILLLLFSAFIITVDYAERYDFPNTPGQFIGDIPLLISHTFQFFLIVLIYYFFYLVNHYFLINRLLKNKGIIYYLFGLLGTVVLFYPIAAQLIAWIPMVQTNRIHPVVNVSVFDSVNASIPLVGMLLTIPFILTVQWFKQSSEIATLDKEKSDSELSLLKQQINPHFFFNTLNNLYALSIKKDEATPEVIMKLSELMRYVIYKGKENKVRLADEIKYIEDYVSLQKLRRYKELDFQFEKDIENQKAGIPPLLFIILVENAFKHGIEPAENESFLHIHLKSRKNRLTFCCINSVEGKIKKEPGIGLKNLRRRLDLMYPGQYNFSVENGDYTFKAILEINPI